MNLIYYNIKLKYIKYSMLFLRIVSKLRETTLAAVVLSFVYIYVVIDCRVIMCFG